MKNDKMSEWNLIDTKMMRELMTYYLTPIEGFEDKVLEIKSSLFSNTRTFISGAFKKRYQSEIMSNLNQLVFPLLEEYELTDKMKQKLADKVDYLSIAEKGHDVIYTPLQLIIVTDLVKSRSRFEDSWIVWNFGKDILNENELVKMKGVFKVVYGEDIEKVSERSNKMGWIFYKDQQNNIYDTNSKGREKVFIVRSMSLSTYTKEIEKTL